MLNKGTEEAEEVRFACAKDLRFSIPRSCKMNGMSIQDIWAKFNPKEGVSGGLSQIFRILENDEVFVAILLLLVAVTAFGLGRMSVEVPETAGGQSAQTIESEMTSKKEGVFQDQDEVEGPLQEVEKEVPQSVGEMATSTMYIGSKNGTKYHLPWCPGAKQIKEENKIFFTSKSEAEDAGYTPSANCKGI